MLFNEYLNLQTNQTSENGINKLLSQIEQRATYQDILKFAEDLEANISKSNWAEAEKFWMHKFQSKIPHMTNTTRNDFFLKSHQDFITHYSTYTQEPRFLLLCFTGMFGGIMIPNWVFLNHLPTNITDVVLFDTPRDITIPDYIRFKPEWDSIVKTYELLLQDLHPSHTAVMGVSGGCSAAALFSLSQPVDRAMLVATTSLKASSLARISEKAATAPHDSRLKAKLLVGLKDVRALRELLNFHRLFSNRKYTIIRDSGHSVLSVLFRSGRLKSALMWLGETQ